MKAAGKWGKKTGAGGGGCSYTLLLAANEPEVSEGQTPLPGKPGEGGVVGGGSRGSFTRANELKRCMNILRLSRATPVYYVTPLQTPFVCIHAVRMHYDDRHNAK